MTYFAIAAAALVVGGVATYYITMRRLQAVSKALGFSEAENEAHKQRALAEMRRAKAAAKPFNWRDLVRRSRDW